MTQRWQFEDNRSPCWLHFI